MNNANVWQEVLVLAFTRVNIKHLTDNIFRGGKEQRLILIALKESRLNLNRQTPHGLHEAILREICVLFTVLCQKVLFRKKKLHIFF